MATQNGAVMNYDFGPKRNWRRWAWNRIAERANPKDALVLYLAGERDFDRGIAMSKGFQAANMIAVERNAKTLNALRGSGVLTIDADFFDAVEAASDRRRINVVLADLCGGLRWNYVADVMHWLCKPTLADTVFCFNLLRGRDAESNDLRKMLEAHGSSFGKHRAAILLYTCLYGMANFDLFLPDAGARDGGADSRLYDYIDRCNAKTFSYKSNSGQIFDSIVFQNPCRESISKRGLDATWHAFMSGLSTEPDKGFISAKKSVAAVMAHRTRRLQQIPSSPPQAGFFNGRVES